MTYGHLRYHPLRGGPVGDQLRRILQASVLLCLELHGARGVASQTILDPPRVMLSPGHSRLCPGLASLGNERSEESNTAKTDLTKTKTRFSGVARYQREKERETVAKTPTSLNAKISAGGEREAVLRSARLNPQNGSTTPPAGQSLGQEIQSRQSRVVCPGDEEANQDDPRSGGLS
ncbi:hypothetical protein G5I_03363 [Acromyrmex echinatior]|uniref:Uncharacterized protein n=1 Tax=Acromyrmex echinatior TaxID=103372 RepID=F4WCT3_ACREC|nr:hypothetical protein G5I_03363 [Acromyrmex echinatior]